MEKPGGRNNIIVPVISPQTMSTQLFVLKETCIFSFVLHPEVLVVPKSIPAHCFCIGCCLTVGEQTPEDSTDLNLTSTFTEFMSDSQIWFPKLTFPPIRLCFPSISSHAVLHLLSGCHLTWHVDCTMINLALWHLTTSQRLKTAYPHSWQGQCYISLTFKASLTSRKFKSCCGKQRTRFTSSKHQSYWFLSSKRDSFLGSQPKAFGASRGIEFIVVCSVGKYRSD